MKQYLLLLDDSTKPVFQEVCSKLQFLEVQGLNVNGQNNLQLLATPVYPPVNPAQDPTPPAQPPVEEAPQS